jgi:hypothetical protein
VTITLVPLIFAMQYTPDLKAGSSAVLELATQLKWALAGLLFAVLVLGWVLKGFIHRQAGQFATKHPTPAAVA